ncbi:hypothetical protein G7Z17_g3911 [Cylindrodendrum hubeiense]|uniref:Uncharacterized protein n=1 Tax=Cylindrodendrum hubeiense TaxID=595255 RepID=A0A9P5LD52_9HYPO|nr:hypothetical protein G7Z17_g3911 [Cylindrodendrum hubeiense]
MGIKYDESPEVVFSSVAPEVYHGSHQQGHEMSESQSNFIKPSNTPYYQPGYAPASATPTTNYQNTLNYPPPANPTRGPSKQRFLCGCTLTVLILSIIIAVLSVLVIGLSAGTGTATSNYNIANQKLQALSASYAALKAATVSVSSASEPSATASATSEETDKTASATSATASATSTSYSDITLGCSDEDESTTGTNYISEFYDKTEYTIHCNHDAPNDLLFSLFTGNFEGCMEACTAWNSNSVTNSTLCQAVSFIPLWTNITIAAEGYAAGDCYLKPKPQTIAKLGTPNIGTECHAAIRSS